MKQRMILLPLLLLSVCLYGQNKPLTQEQKLKDFEFLYNVIKENYPYLEVNKRVNGVDWLANRERYVELIKKTETDSAYIFAIKGILAGLNSGHVGMGPTMWQSDYLGVYKRMEPTYKYYKEWIKELEGKEATSKYWSAILESENKKAADNKPKKPAEENLSCYIAEPNRIAVIKINSFNMYKMDKDGVKLLEFLKSIKDYKYLLVDIQNNSGGATDYWHKYLVAPLISKPIVYSMRILTKDGPVNRRFYGHFIDRAGVLTEADRQPNMPGELFASKHYFAAESDTIAPSNNIGFNGKIFVLTSKTVFSSSEALAVFCKITGWATLIGERTGGDGMGSDPVIVSLPESRILLTYTSQFGLNPDGSINDEMKTMPDIEMKGADSKERLTKVLDYIKSLKE